MILIRYQIWWTFSTHRNVFAVILLNWCFIRSFIANYTDSLNFIGFITDRDLINAEIDWHFFRQWNAFGKSLVQRISYRAGEKIRNLWVNWRPRLLCGNSHEQWYCLQKRMKFFYRLKSFIWTRMGKSLQHSINPLPNTTRNRYTLIIRFVVSCSQVRTVHLDRLLQRELASLF